MADKKEKKAGWFGHLRSGRGKKDSESDLEQSAGGLPDADGPPAEKKSNEPDPALLKEFSGPLLQLWQKWDPMAPPPVLSLRGEDRKRELPIDDKELTQERLRVGVKLDQLARKRLQDMSKAKEAEPRLSAACEALVSRNGMVAWLFLFPPIGVEEDIRLEEIGKAMEAAHITDGVDAIAVTRLFQDKPYFRLIPVAWGTPPVQGEDGSVIERYPRERTRELQVDEMGRVDYRAQTYVQTIEKGDVICDIKLPVEGKAGARVDGKTEEPKPVKAAKVPQGSNTTVTEDGLQLIATMDGHLEFSGSVFQVKPFLDIHGDVDYSTGNIDFRGDVHISGDVRENFSVRATGTITIDGLVEAANVEAGGNLIISRGVLGDNRALVKCRGSLRAKYLENCVAYAGECIYADCIISSQIFSDDRISVKSGRGTVIGGALTAARKVEAEIIGSQSGTRTEIILGILPYVQGEQRNIEEDLKAIRREQEELEKMLAYMEERQGLGGSTEKLAKAHLRKSVLAMKVEKLLKRRKDLEPMTLTLDGCRLECGTVYPITVLKVGQAKTTIQSVSKHCIAGYDAEEEIIKFY